MKTCLTRILLLFLFVFSLWQLWQSFGVYDTEKSAVMMNTPIRIKVRGRGVADLVDQGFREITRLERQFSRFDEKSEVGLINHLAGQAPLQVSADTTSCLTLAEKIKKLSGGAFNVRFSGKIDLGGIGKGYAVEAARQLLLKKGAKSGMIDMRSSIAVFGPRSWRIGVQDPRDKEKLLGVVTLHDGQSLSTSGDYERGRHIIDPRTKRPAKLCQAVTVIGQNAAETDALSTALFVLGPDKGIALAKSLPNTEALIIDARGKEYQTSGFRMEKR